MIDCNAQVRSHEDDFDGRNTSPDLGGSDEGEKRVHKGGGQGSPNDVFRKTPVNKGKTFHGGGNKGKQLDARKEVTKRIKRLVKKVNATLASWDGDTFGMSKIGYDHSELEVAYSSLASWLITVLHHSISYDLLCFVDVSSFVPC